jgi:hypothetical protein
LGIETRFKSANQGKPTDRVEHCWKGYPLFRRNFTAAPKLCCSGNRLGMTAAQQQHLFEPFFTTKPVGKGVSGFRRQVFSRQWSAIDARDPINPP